MNYGNQKKDRDRDRECNCRLRIDDSLVLVICGEFDPRELRDSVNAFYNVKDTAEDD